MLGICLTVVIHTLMWHMLGAEMTISRTKFKAAVYGHAMISPPVGNVSRSDALRYMRRNLDVYRTQATEAKIQGADILVFPEDGIYGTTFTRESIYNYLENIPPPLAPPWSPCSQPHLHPGTEVLQELSCIAKNNSLYIVANMGDKQPCDVEVDPKCPSDGRYQYNTDVAFDPDGVIVAKYHKYHLFYEDQFDTPSLEMVTFDTPFGKFGMMVCFDVLFLEPGLPMILKNNVANIVFPTAWMDALPLLSALGFHSSFARALGVNFLAADIHRPESRMHGSGVYSPDGMKAFYYGAAPASPAKLLIAELDVMEKPRPNINIPTDDDPFSRPQTACEQINNGAATYLEPEEFNSELFKDIFTFRILETGSGSMKVCQKEVCCSLRYAVDEKGFGEELFAFGAFDGLHTYEGQYYFQICALVKCADAKNRSTCGAATDTSTTQFTMLELNGQMTTPFIYPQMVFSNGSQEIILAEAKIWGFQNASLWTNDPPGKALLSAALYGRDYGRDNCKDESVKEVMSIHLMTFLVIAGLVTARIFW